MPRPRRRVSTTPRRTCRQCQCPKTVSTMVRWRCRTPIQGSSNRSRTRSLQRRTTTRPRQTCPGLATTAPAVSRCHNQPHLSFARATPSMSRRPSRSSRLLSLLSLRWLWPCSQRRPGPWSKQPQFRNGQRWPSRRNGSSQRWPSRQHGKRSPRLSPRPSPSRSCPPDPPRRQRACPPDPPRRRA